MQLCKSCKSHLPEGAKFCSVCGQAVPAARIPDNSSFASPPSRYTTVKESTSTYKSPVTPLPLTPEDGKILPPISYTTVSPLSGYTTSSPPDYPGSSQSSASNRD